MDQCEKGCGHSGQRRVMTRPSQRQNPRLVRLALRSPLPPWFIHSRTANEQQTKRLGE